MSTGTEYSGGGVAVVVTDGRTDGDVAFERVIVDEVGTAPDGADPVVVVVTTAASPFAVNGDSDGVCAAGRSPERDEQAASSNNAAVTISRVRPGRPFRSTRPLPIARSLAPTSRRGAVSRHLIGIGGLIAPNVINQSHMERAGPNPNGAIELGIRWVLSASSRPN